MSRLRNALTMQIGFVLTDLRCRGEIVTSCYPVFGVVKKEVEFWRPQLFIPLATDVTACLGEAPGSGQNSKLVSQVKGRPPVNSS